MRGNGRRRTPVVVVIGPTVTAEGLSECGAEGTVGTSGRGRTGDGGGGANCSWRPPTEEGIVCWEKRLETNLQIAVNLKNSSTSFYWDQMRRVLKCK